MGRGSGERGEKIDNDRVGFEVMKGKVLGTVEDVNAFEEWFDALKKDVEAGITALAVGKYAEDVQATRSSSRNPQVQQFSAVPRLSTIVEPR